MHRGSKKAKTDSRTDHNEAGADGRQIEGGQVVLDQQHRVCAVVNQPHSRLVVVVDSRKVQRRPAIALPNTSNERTMTRLHDIEKHVQ